MSDIVFDQDFRSIVCSLIQADSIGEPRFDPNIIDIAVRYAEEMQKIRNARYSSVPFSQRRGR
jgi:hypothetical protein